MFSPVSLTGNSDLKLMGLAPMAVLPMHQNKSIGSNLVREGLEQCKSLGISAVVVLGHPEFYPRFGFLPSSQYNISSEYNVPEDVFMVKELISGALKRRAGQVKYHAAFNNI